jgi:hypothetical protein
MGNIPALRERRESAWRAVQVVGGTAALVAAIVFRRWLGAEFLLFRGLGVLSSGPRVLPTDATQWLALLQTDRLVGLTLLNVFDMVNYVLVGLMFLGVYAALRKRNSLFLTVAVAIAFTGIGLYLASNKAFSLLALSDQHAATTAGRPAILVAAQVLLRESDPLSAGTGVFWAFILVTTAELVIAVVMLRSDVFGRPTAIVGIVANAFGLGYFVTVLAAPAWTFAPLSASAPLLLVWYLLTGIRLIRLRRPREGSDNAS